MKDTMAKGPSIPQLIERARVGDQGAFADLVSRSREKLESIIRFRVRPELRDRLDMEALAGDTLGRAFESLERFVGSDENAWFAWLAGIARNVVLKEIERLGRSRTFSLDREIPADDPSASRTLRREERFERLREALEGLSEDHREAIRLCRIEGLSTRDAARKMNRSPEAVKMLLWRALQELKFKFGDTGSLHLPDRSFGEEGGGHGT
jgi:RNA polymerase sigma factor (sigma-70 family)